MIKISNVSKAFIHKKTVKEALKNVSFECHKGEIFGLLGPNGAGKTTLLRIIAAIMSPTCGSVTVNGFDSQRESEKSKNSIGYLSNETGLYDRITPRELLSFFGKISGIEKSKLESRVNEVIEEMEIVEFADKRIEKFSTGMKQKVSIARSLIHNPPVIIFDEPTNGLDVIAGRIVKKRLLKLKEDGKCIILSTHLMNDVEQLCDRIGIIHKGTLLDIGTKAEIKTRFGAQTLEDVFFRIVGDYI